MSSTEVSIDMIAEHIRQTLLELERVFRGQLFLMVYIVVTTASGSTYAVSFMGKTNETEEFIHEGQRYLTRPARFTRFNSSNDRGSATDGYVGFSPDSKAVIALDAGRRVVTRTSPVVAFREVR